MLRSLFTSKNTEAVQQLFLNTFSDSEGTDEGKVIGQLVNNLLSSTASNDITVFTATEEDQLNAAIIFTTLTLPDNRKAYILSPVAVATEQQGKGLGQALINYGIEYLKLQGVKLVFTYGDPNFYSKVGFQQISEKQIQAPQPLSYPEGWLCQSLLKQAIPTVNGKTSCVAALNKPSYW